LQKPLTKDIVNQAKEFVRKAGSERAAERKAKKVNRMLSEILDNSQDLKEKLYDKYKLEKLNISISDRNN